jgi:hypothetical protein
MSHGKGGENEGKGLDIAEAATADTSHDDQETGTGSPSPEGMDDFILILQRQTGRRAAKCRSRRLR